MIRVPNVVVGVGLVLIGCTAAGDSERDVAFQPAPVGTGDSAQAAAGTGGSVTGDASARGGDGSTLGAASVDGGPSADAAAPPTGDASLALDASATSDSGGAATDASSSGATTSDSATSDGGTGMPLVGCSPTGAAQNCGTFTTGGGKQIQLGPYGASMDQNVGKGFENAIDSGDRDGNLVCGIFASTFGQDKASTDRQLDITGLKMDLYTVYRPANWPAETKLPIITWGNGTCAKPEGYGALLRYIASHGFFVVAANSRWVGSGSPQKKGVDFALAANKDPQSPYYQKLDTAKVAAAGHSQGAMGTAAAASDARILNVILFNGGNTSTKPFLTVSGERDLFSATPASMKKDISEAAKAAFLFYHMVPGTGSSDGHLTLMIQPERVTDATVAWFKYLLLGDSASKDWLVGDSCKLCGHAAEYEYGQKGL